MRPRRFFAPPDRVTAGADRPAALERPRAARFAVVMLLNTEDGNTYTADEYEAWLREAGFTDVQVEDADAERQLITATR